MAERTDTFPITITELTPDLIPRAALLLAQHLSPQNFTMEDQASCTAILLRLLDWPSAQFFLAAQNGALVGFASINWGFSTRKGQPILRVQDLFTLPAYRRRGVATSLLQHLVDLAHQQGAGRLQLETGTQNTAARALYSRFSFEWFRDKEIYMLFL